MASSTAIVSTNPESQSLSSQKAKYEDGDVSLENQSDPAAVWIHVYDIDPYTGWLNRAFLKNAHLGLFHCGVEAWSVEWSFQYFEDAWDDDVTSGVLECIPRHMDGGYIYRESIFMGTTPLSPEAVDDIVEEMQQKWPASTYHITKRNCITFAQELVSKLVVEKPFPEWISGLPRTGMRWGVSTVVDYGWDIAKWYMIRKHEPSQQQIRLQNLDQEIHGHIMLIDRLQRELKDGDGSHEAVLKDRILKAEQELSDMRDERGRLQYEASTSSLSVFSLWRCGGPPESISLAKPASIPKS